MFYLSMWIEVYWCKFRKIQGKELILALENSIRGVFSSVMGVSFVQSDENRKIV